MDKKTQVKGLLVVSMLICASVVAIIAISPLDRGTYTYKLGTFQSYNELLAFLKKRAESSSAHGYGLYAPSVSIAKSGAERTDNALQAGTTVPDYSKTNVQVAGVDEPDIVKTDGSFLYLVENGRVTIVKAYPVMDAAVVSRISFNNSTSISNIFIYGDRLIVFGIINSYSGWPYPLLREDVKVATPMFIWGGGSSTTLIAIYDISDKTNPVLVKEVKIDGYYFDARMIDNYVYVVASEYTNTIYYAYDENNVTLNIPQISIDNVSRNISVSNIYYVDVPELSDTMTHVISIDLQTNDVAEKSFLLGGSETMYVSKNAIFLAATHYPYYAMPMRNSETSSAESNQQTTIIHKISINTGNVSYIAQGEVPGRVLNEFSMDEYNGYFRIATTIDAVWNTEAPSSNNIYILDDALKQVGKIEKIAPGESIYAVRFMGDRAFLVTFVQVDPLFTVDLSDPSNPRILGELKIPGYSDYLQPYDENHIIGIGKEVDPTIDADKVHTPGAIYYTAILGLKIALFDVTDIEHPVEEAKVVIGDRGTDSPALYDHKALLFDREKNLLVLPVSVYEIPQEIKDQYAQSNGTTDLSGTFTFQGAYVYRLTLQNGFELRGRVTHQTPEQQQQLNSTWYWGSSNTDISRALYIGDTLYTISGSMIKMNSLTDLSDQNSLSLAYP
ncbi:MAG TPA: beta-propeller domain-containing protein [Candidatus Thermoplasmatota archaeon]|nr:beta-propeller domain-containing protein [Candidatus Thermoplasmatota archaeon]